MNQNTLRHKGYTASVKFEPDDGCYVGDVIGIKHTIFFSGATIDEAYENFKDLVDDYPAACADLGLQPCPPPGQIMVPIPTELFAKVSSHAETSGIPLQTLMERALQQAVP